MAVDKKLTELTLVNVAKVSDLIYLVTYDDDGVAVSRAVTVEELQGNYVSGINRIISGSVVWTGTGYVFESVELTYEIDGFIYYSHGEQVTLSAPDATNDRFDVIFVDSTGLDVKEGTPASSPSVPSLDNPLLEISTNIVLVSVGTTTPGEITVEAIYSENAQEVGGEWDTSESTSGVRIDLANTTNPINLTKDIDASVPEADDYMEFTNTTPITIASFKNLRQTFRSAGNWKNDSLLVNMFDGATLVGKGRINSNSFPTSDTVTTHEVFLNDGQGIKWKGGETQFDTIRYTWEDGGGVTAVSNARFHIDLISVEHGGTTTSSRPVAILAEDVTVDASGFSGNLSATDTDVQTALETIDSMSVNDIPIMYNVKDYGAVGDGVTDDTVDIQTAIQAVFDAGGGILYFPIGVYIVGGALQNNVGADLIDYNSQLYIPDIDADASARPSIEFLGEVQPNLSQTLGINTWTPPNTGVVIRSTIQGTGTRPSVIANRGAATNSVANISYTSVKFKNISIQITPNGSSKMTIGAFNMNYSAIANFEYCTAYPYNLNLVSSAVPDVNDIVGISMPSINTEHINTVKNCTVGGFTHGYTAADHTSFYDAISICCSNGFTQDANYHVSTYVKVSAFWCINSFNVSGASFFNVVNLQTEWDSDTKWYDSVNTIVDASDNGIGTFNWNITEANVGYNADKFVKNGGDKIKTNPICVDGLANLQVGTTYTPTILDAYRVTKLTNAGAITVTIPADSTLNYDIDAGIDFYQGGAGQVTFVGAGGVTINTPETLKLRGQYSACSLIKEASNTWLITGDLELV